MVFSDFISPLSPVRVLPCSFCTPRVSSCPSRSRSRRASMLLLGPPCAARRQARRWGGARVIARNALAPTSKHNTIPCVNISQDWLSERASDSWPVNCQCARRLNRWLDAAGSQTSRFEPPKRLCLLTVYAGDRNHKQRRRTSLLFFAVPTPLLV